MEQAKQSVQTAWEKTEPLSPCQMPREAAQKRSHMLPQSRDTLGPTPATVAKAPPSYPHRHFFYIQFVFPSNQRGFLVKPVKTSNKKTCIILEQSLPPQSIPDLNSVCKSKLMGCWSTEAPSFSSPSSSPLSYSSSPSAPHPLSSDGCAPSFLSLDFAVQCWLDLCQLDKS